MSENVTNDAAMIRKDRAALAKAGRLAGLSEAAIRRAMGNVDKPKRRKAPDKWNGNPPTVSQVLLVFVEQMKRHAWPVTLEELKSDRLLRAWAAPRQVAMALVRTILGKDDRNASLSAIGREFGRNHATVKHALETGAHDQIMRDPRLKKAANETVRFFGR
jgi:hypothetical protein